MIRLQLAKIGHTIGCGWIASAVYFLESVKTYGNSSSITSTELLHNEKLMISFYNENSNKFQ